MYLKNGDIVCSANPIAPLGATPTAPLKKPYKSADNTRVRVGQNTSISTNKKLHAVAKFAPRLILPSMDAVPKLPKKPKLVKENVIIPMKNGKVVKFQRTPRTVSKAKL